MTFPHRIKFGGVEHSDDRGGTLYTGEIVYCEVEGVGANCGIAFDKKRKDYVLYDGGKVVKVGGDLSQLHAHALAYFAIMGNFDGFPTSTIER